MLEPSGGNARPEAAFGSIEGAEAYVALLPRTVEETAEQMSEELRLTRGSGGRRREAQQLVAFELGQLRLHLGTSRRRLGDLR